MRKHSIKNTRINMEVQRELSSILQHGLKDPRVTPWISVVAAEVAPDLKTCKVYVSVLGDEKVQEETMRGLNSALGYIRRELAQSLNLRNTPELRFILDQSIEYGVNMSKKIDTLMKRTEASKREASKTEAVKMEAAGAKAADIEAARTEGEENDS